MLQQKVFAVSWKLLQANRSPEETSSIRTRSVCHETCNHWRYHHCEYFLDYIRLSTTVATNALLERKGHKHALLITKGFKDLLLIGNQSRPKIFDLNIRRPPPLYSTVLEIDERVTLVGYTSDPKAALDKCIDFLPNRSSTRPLGHTTDVTSPAVPLADASGSGLSLLLSAKEC